MTREDLIFALLDMPRGAIVKVSVDVHNHDGIDIMDVYPIDYEDGPMIWIDAEQYADDLVLEQNPDGS